MEEEAEARLTCFQSRRIFLFRGMAGAAAIACATRSFGSADAAASAACTLTAEQTVGPYYIDLGRVRHDITESKAGVPLKLRLRVVDAQRCQPIENAALDLWHCDASGVYSGFTANSPDGPPGGFGGPPPMGPPPDGRGGPPPGPPRFGFGTRKHDGTTFLRGVQLTDSEGMVEFATIYPGWYMGRSLHIHMRVHVGGKTAGGKYTGGHISYTGQLFFPEATTDAVAKCQPYAKRSSERTHHEEDNVFTEQHGSESIVALAQLDAREIEAGFVATSLLRIDPNATSQDMGPGGPGFHFGRPPQS